ncbi:cupin domain-containing protein [Aliiroseovarius sp. 2305UL8-7]|uniref:cupin domain-containing protein n=1 Tax=Aliiroseovarius conchicola TaxID=3121637 RepID=UPI003529B499
MTVATNFMVPTENRPYLPLANLPGIGLKPMNIKEDTPIWSAVMRIESGACLPKRQHDGMCEVFVVRGNGTFADGTAFQRGDYVREENGEYDKITAKSELVVFFTHHGTCRFLGDDEKVLLEMDHMTKT